VEFESTCYSFEHSRVTTERPHLAAPETKFSFPLTYKLQTVTERVPGFEPRPKDWKSLVLAIKHHTRKFPDSKCGSELTGISL